MARVLLDELIDTDFGQFDLLWTPDYGFDGDFDRFFAGQVNGLVGAGSGRGLFLNLARRSGGSEVCIVLLDHAPGPPDDIWEDVVEVSTTVAPGSRPRWSTWAAESGGPLDLPPGEYRVRTSARGRDAARAEMSDDGDVDAYLVEIWTAPPRPDAILRTTSQDAAHWHRFTGGRR